MKNRLCLLAVITTAAVCANTAHAQPGMTPPGSTPPGSYPPPAQPAPYPAPGPATQPGYMPPPPIAPAVPQRRGWIIGFSFGVGTLQASNGFECFNCENDPPAFSGQGYFGFMLSPRFALLAEISGTARPVDSTGTGVLTLGSGYIAGQYWLTPRAWLRLGAGTGTLSYSYDNNGEVVSEGGAAVSGSAGYELMHTPRFGLDLLLRGEFVTFEDSTDVGATTVGLGMSWY